MTMLSRLLKKPPLPVALSPRVTDPRKRVRNLEKKRVLVLQQLANPNLKDPHRPEVARRLSSIEAEIKDLEGAIHGYQQIV
jgi:hypothetical protein